VITPCVEAVGPVLLGKAEQLRRDDHPIDADA
jgi:hypothetical protein